MKMAKFGAAGVDFGICFVTKGEPDQKRLAEFAYENHVEIGDVGASDDGYFIKTVSSVGGDEQPKEDKSEYINGFLNAIKDDEWYQDRDTVNGEKVLIFYSKEALS